MASTSSGSSHLGVTDNQKRWLVAGIALNKILIPQIRPYVEQGINTEYNNLKTSHNIHGQSTSGRLQRWPARTGTLLKYENINGNDVHPRLYGRLNYSLFDCRVTSHVDFARLYVGNYMAKFAAFDEHCDASAVLSLLGRVPAFSAATQAAAADVRMARNYWAHCDFSTWSQAKFQQSILEMEQLVKVLGLPTADERKLIAELRDWETKGTHLCMNSPVDPILLQLVQQNLNSPQDEVKNVSADCEEEETTVQAVFQFCASSVLEDLQQRVVRPKTDQQKIEHQAELTENRIGDLEDRVTVVEEKHEGVQTLLREPDIPSEGSHFIGRKTEKANTYYDLGNQECQKKYNEIPFNANNLTKALDIYQRTLQSELELFGENHPRPAHSYHLLGVTQYQMKDFTSALQSHQSALDIRLKLFGENHPLTANSYHALGVTQYQMEDFTSALQSYQTAWDIRLKLFREDHEQTDDSYHSLGVTQHEMIEMTKTFEAEHRECLRVLPYSDGGQVYVQLYVYSGKRGIPEELKDAAQECFGKMDVKLKWSDLYNDASNVLNVTSVDYPSGKPQRLEVSQVDEINKIVNENLHILSRHRNITAVQASFKVTKSKQTDVPCIMVYVLGKGRIPIGESEIPNTIGKYPVDIVDGFWIKTLDPWQPTEAQEQSDYIRLGASIGVRGEKGSGTLGAVVKDESSGALYLLSCDHVIKSKSKQSEIIHPGWEVHLNFFKYHLNEYSKWIGRITETNYPKTSFSLDSLQDHENLLEKFKELKAIKEKHSTSVNIPGNKLRKIKEHEEALEFISSKPPRSVSNYTTGVFNNVEWSDGKEYFIDAAIAVLKGDEVNALKLSGTTEIIGTGDYPSGDCIPATTKAIMNAGELLKSGSFTGYTSSNRLVGASIVAPSFLQGPAYELNGAFVSVKTYYCENCAKSLLTQCEIEVQGLDHFTCVRCTNKVSQCKSSWRKNCLCIESERYPFVNRGDSGAVIFEKHDPRQVRLPGFGIVFGMLETAYKSYALASPLEIALKTLSQNVSTTCNLKLVSKYEQQND